MNLPFTADEIFSVKDQQFNALALNIFRYQLENNSAYRRYVDYLEINPAQITHYINIPFLPIELFKNMEIRTAGPFEGDEKWFESSSTTGIGVSKHFYKDSSYYTKAFEIGFENRMRELFGSNDFELEIIALLPGYLERGNSSLVYMVNSLMQKYNQKPEAFYLNDYKGLLDRLNELKDLDRPILLIGVAHALLDLINSSTFEFPNLFVMETGGMKGRKKEITREELHRVIKKGFGIDRVLSEYGMTELFSQAYSLNDGIFQCPPWMKIIIRDRDDPFATSLYDKSGGINVIDLANIQSCCFIATSDLGRLKSNGDFEVLGRFDHSDIRGCSLLVQ